MLRPNVISRTLKGVGGKRYWDVPGVVYPQKVLKVPPGYNPRDGKPYTEAPNWGISTRQAALLLSCSTAAARHRLHLGKIPFRVVMDGKSPMQIYWQRRAVEKLAQKNRPLMVRLSPKLITSEEALALLGRGRSSLHRYCLRGKLHTIRVRKETSAGVRCRNYYIRSEVMKFKLHLNALEKIRKETQKQEKLFQRLNKEGERELQKICQGI